MTVGSKTLQINNHNDDARKFDISASVSYDSNGKAVQIDGGVVFHDNKQTATFRKNMGGANLSVDLYSADEVLAGEVISEIYAFVKAVTQEEGV